ncbi:MAG: gliding motility-associated C-terminal domain-containing protein [Sphingobacteriaceae bacterium]|nr:gliding motility-associated C-terminal domain-containing protein [Sphingobacteriaceae bacterium]
MKKILNILFILSLTFSYKLNAQCAGCPTVDAQFNTGPQVNICLGQSANLSASNTPILGANTSSYTVSSIPYNPLPFTGGNVAVSNCDDCWGAQQTLPFNFCFYGNTFTNFIAGSNGVLTFDPTAVGYCPWPISAPWPNIIQINRINDIGAPWRDINMAGGSSARWYVTGTAPTRTAVIYWGNVPYYSCGMIGGQGETMQIQLMESTSVIEIHIQTSQSCPWNSGAGIVGIQNATPVGVIPPARNFPGAWSTTNESWRFSPMPAVPSWTWTSPTGTVATGTTSVTVNPTVTTTYSAYVIPGCPPGTVQVVVNTPPVITPTNNSPICQGTAINLLAGGGGTNTTYAWTGPNSYTSSFQNPVIANAQPSMTGTYSLVATNNFTAGPSCASSGTTQVSVVPVDQVTVTPNYTLCQGDALNLNANNLIPPMSYSWAGPNSFTSTLQNPTLPNATPVLNGDYTATATFSTPGIPLVCTSSAVSNVSVVATSPLTLTMPANICEGFTANLSATANPMPLQFDWTGPNNFNASGNNVSIPGVLPSHTGVYNVVATWAIGTKSCTINSFNQMNVVPVAPIAINAPTMVCYPDNVHLTSSSQGAISYSWGATTGFTSNIPSPILGAPGTTATGIYTVFTAYTNGALICYNSNTTQVTVNPIIPVDLIPYKQLCFNSTYSISAPAGATSYLWLGPNNYTNTNQLLVIPSIQMPYAGTYTLEVMLGPCKTKGTTQVDVLTPISFTQTPGNKTICQGDSIALIAGASGGSHNYAYVWNPQQWLGSPTGSVQYGHPQGTTIYNLTAYDIACPFYTIGASFTVNVNKAPEPQLDLTKHEGCEPLCLNFNSKTQALASQISYDFGGGTVLQADDFNYCFNEAGTYSLKIKTTGKNGCTYLWEYPTPIHVYPTPNTILESDPVQVTTTNNNVTFYPSSTKGNVVQYQWHFDGVKGGNAGNDTSSMKNPTRIYDVIGDYPLLLISTTDKGCIDTLFKVIEVRDEFAIFIPNTFTPNGDNLNDIFNVKGVGMKAEGYSMEIYDRWGSLIYSTKEITKGWDGTVKGLFAENGVYVYKIKAQSSNGEGRKEYVGHVSLLK